MISILKVLILQMIHTLTMPRLSSKVKHQKKPVVQCQLSRFRQLRWFWGCTTTLQVLVMENYRKKVYYYYNKVYMYLRKTTDRQIGLPFKKNFFISCLFYFSPGRGLWPPLQNDAMLEHKYVFGQVGHTGVLDYRDLNHCDLQNTRKIQFSGFY